MKKFGIKLALFYLILSISCKDNQKPEGIANIKTMANTIAELQLAEARVARISLIGIDSVKVVYDYLKADIYKKNHMDSIKFVKSYDYYSRDKNQLYEIYDEAEKILQAKKSK